MRYTYRCVLAAALATLLGAGLSETDALVIRDIPGLTSITFWEMTGPPVKPYTFGVNSQELTTRLTDPLTSANRDFVGVSWSEFYDVFYSDADGTFNMDGNCISVEAVYGYTAPSGGALNIAEIDLNYLGAPMALRKYVASFVALGDNIRPGSASLAIDGDYRTFPSLGNTVGQSERLRLTIGLHAVPDCASTMVLLGGSFAVLLAVSRSKCYGGSTEYR